MTPVPPNFVANLIALAALMIAAIGLMISTGKADVDQAKKNEQRVCRLEAIAAVGECKR